MSLMNRLKATTTSLARGAGALALGVSLVAAIAGGLPGVALAQTARVTAGASDHGGPGLWVIRDADSTLYLFGTVHLLRPTTLWRWVNVEEAFDSSSRVVFEISNPDDQAAVVPLIQQYGVSPQTPLSSLLTAEELASLDTAAKAIGSSAEQLDPLRPWLAALTLSVAPLAKAGYDPASGVELSLKARAQAAGKPISGLETLDEQIRILAGFSEADQLAFLRSTLTDFESATVELDRLVAAWATGDVDAIETIGVDSMRQSSEQIYQALLVRRNTNWANQIQTMLEGSGTVFIAVGSAHLAGDDSVQAILEARGVDVEVVP